MTIQTVPFTRGASLVGALVSPQERAATGQSPIEPFSFQDNVLYALFWVGIIANTVLQKIGLPLKAGDTAPLVLPLFGGAMLIAATLVRPRVDPIRVAGYFLFLLLSSVSTVFLAPTYSAASLMLFAALYLPMIVTFDTGVRNFARCMDAFVTVMLVFVGVTVAQHVLQIVFTFRAWPNLNLLLPTAWLIPEYNYLQPIVFGSRLMKPNGIAFLEVSLLSQYIALALAVELVLFQRMNRMLVLAAGTMITFAGTGGLLLLMTLPVLLGRMRIRTGIIVLVVLVVLCLIGYKVGWFDIVSSRMNEYKQNGSSANMRFIVPLERLVDFLHNPGSLIAGIGAGMIEKGRNFQWWPFTKAAIEYGFLPACIFYAYFLYSLFSRAPYKSLAFVLAVWFTFEGALLTAVNPLTCVLLGSLLAVVPQRRPRSAAAALPGGEGAAARVWTASPPVPQARPEPETQPAEEEIVELSGDALLDLHGAPGTDGRLVYAIGDVHGRADLLARLIVAIREDARDRGGEAARPVILFLGDYVDRGPDSKGVIDQILVLEQDSTVEVRSLLGNHEEAMLAFLDGRTTGVNWGRYGGIPTVSSYGVPAPTPDAGEAGWSEARPVFIARVPSDHVDFLRRLEHYVVIGDLVFVHAGIRAGVPLEKQRLRDLLFIRGDFLSKPVDSNRIVVHGHTPRDEAYGAKGRICLDTGAYATGVLTAARFDGGRPQLISVSARGSTAG